jgi:hypothetical protein
VDSITQKQTLIAYMFPEKKGGRGLMQVAGAYIAETLNLVAVVVVVVYLTTLFQQLRLYSVDF